MQLSLPFLDTDEPRFVEIVTSNLAKGAPALHSMTPAEYVARCREMWHECELDEVFSVKIIVDKHLLSNLPSKGMPWDGMEQVSEDEIDEDLYCIALGLVTPEGEFIGAPEGYDSRPTNPRSKRGVAVARKSPVPAEESDEAVPAPYLLALLDFLGFEDRLSTIGLLPMRDLYDKLIQTALKPHAETNLWSPILTPVAPDHFSPGLFWLPIRYAYFSDSLLLWVPYQPEFVSAFLTRCCDVFCEALRIGVALRGAISAGSLILHKRSNTYLGPELVKAARLEKAQEWLGVILGHSVCSEAMRIPFDPRLVRLAGAPTKRGTEHLLSGLVLDWPRRWRDLHSTTAIDAIEALRDPNFSKYYDNASSFVRFSDSDPDWFLRDAPKPPGT